MSVSRRLSGPKITLTPATTEKRPSISEIANHQQLKKDVHDRIIEMVRRKKQEKAQKNPAGKKAFMNPERKRKLKLLLIKAAATEVKKGQEEQAHIRREILEKTIGKDRHSDAKDEKALREICQAYHDRCRQLAEEVYDLERLNGHNDFKINEQTIEVNQLHGKFIKPALKKVGSIRIQRKSESETNTDYRWLLRAAPSSPTSPGKILEELKENQEKPSTRL